VLFGENGRFCVVHSSFHDSVGRKMLHFHAYFGCWYDYSSHNHVKNHHKTPLIEGPSTANSGQSAQGQHQGLTRLGLSKGRPTCDEYPGTALPKLLRWWMSIRNLVEEGRVYRYVRRRCEEIKSVCTIIRDDPDILVSFSC
jgi:hypothetical protein